MFDPIFSHFVSSPPNPFIRLYHRNPPENNNDQRPEVSREFDFLKRPAARLKSGYNKPNQPTNLAASGADEVKRFRIFGFHSHDSLFLSLYSRPGNFPTELSFCRREMMMEKQGLIDPAKEAG